MKGRTIFILAVIGIAGALICTHPGVLFLLRAKKNCTTLDSVHLEPYTPIETEVPADWQTITCCGLTLQAPAEFAPREMDDGSISDTVYQNGSAVLIFSENDFGELELVDEAAKLTQEKLTDFFESIGSEVPQNWYSYYRTLYDLSSDDCNIRSFTQSQTFYAVALLKQISLSAYQGDFDYQTDTDLGFVQKMYGQNSEGKTVKYRIELWDRDNLNRESSVLIAAPDEKQTLTILQSAHLAK